MTTTKIIQYTGLAALALLLPAGNAMADIYVAQGAGGNLLTNAYQVIISDSSPVANGLSEIDGTLPTLSATTPSSLPDLFAFDVTGLTPFSATTVGSTGSLYDTQLFLFNSLGQGIYFNETDPSQFISTPYGTYQIGDDSTLPADYLPAGEYYLGIGTEGVAPQSAGGNIFPYPLTDGSPITAVDGPTGPGGSGTLSKWTESGDDAETGSFQIFLTGAAPLAYVPEPSPFALLGVGGLLLAATVCRRRKSAQV